MNIETHRHHYFDDLQLSSKKFYELVEETINSRKYPKVQCSRTSFSEGGLFSEKREYLKVKRNQYQYLVCAAPFGQSFFISYWLKETESTKNRLFAKIPFIGGWLIKNAQLKTFYQLDTELLFKESISNVIEDAVKRLGSPQGFRQEVEPVSVVN